MCSSLISTSKSRAFFALWLSEWTNTPMLFTNAFWSNCFFKSCFLTGETVEHTPSITPLNYAGKTTTNTVILKTPLCYFGNPTISSCNQSDCEIWLVPALNSCKFSSEPREPLSLIFYKYLFYNDSSYLSSDRHF